LIHAVQSGPVAIGDVEGGQSSSSAPCNQPVFRRIEQCARETMMVRCHWTSEGLHLVPNFPGGLPISILVSDGRQTVSFGGWYDEIEDTAEVAELVEKAIRGDLRLVMKSDGRIYHTFAVEMREDGDRWREVSRMETAFWFRQKPVRVITHLCNEPFGGLTAK